VRWVDVRESQPRLADLGESLLAGAGVVLLCTIRRDGSPRLSPVEPLFWAHDLWLSMLLGSRKARDLLRDDRILVHSVVTNREGQQGEYKLRGRALAENGERAQAAYANRVRESLGWEPVVGRFHLFRVDIEDVTYIRYDAATGDQYCARWPAEDEFVRRGTSPTSLGPKEPHKEVLVP
jgi:hypothetical protein